MAEGVRGKEGEAKAPARAVGRRRRLVWGLAASIAAGALTLTVIRPLLGPKPPVIGTPSGATEQDAVNLQRQVDAAPNDPTLQLRLGNLHVERQRFDLALAPLGKAAEHAGTAGAASLLLAQGGDTPERASEALPHAQMAVAAGPGDARAWEGLIRILYTMGRRGPADAALQEAMRRFPQAQRFRFMRAEAVAQEGRTREAVAVYRSALKTHPDPGAQLMLAVLLARLKQGRDARDAFQRAVELDPGSVTPYLGLAGVYLELGQVAEAERSAYTALQVAPADPEAAYLLARVLLKKGDAASARTAEELLDRVLTLRPDHTPALYERGVALLAAGHARRAVRDLEQVVHAEPARTDARQSYARALRLVGDAAGAAEQLRLAGEHAELEQQRSELTARISENPRTAAAWCDLGDFYLAHDVRPKAIEAYGRALALEPANAKAKAGLAKARGGAR